MHSRFAWAALAATLAIALAGCGGDGGSSVDTPDAGDVPTAEVLPADADGAEGIDPDGSDGTTDDPDASPVDGDDAGEDAGDAGEDLDPLETETGSDALDAALLTGDDVPGNWDEVDPQTGGAGLCGFRLADGADVTSRAAFQSPVGAPALEQLVMRFGSGAGKDSFDEWVQAVEACDETDAVDRTFVVSPYGAKERSDETAGVKLVSDDVTSYTVLIRRGDDLSSVSWATLGTAGSEDVEKFSAVAAKRLADLS